MPKEFELNARNSFVGGWFLDDPSICDGMLNFFETSEAYERLPGIVGSANGPMLNKQSKNSLDMSVDVRLKDARLRRYVDALLEVVESYKNKYRFAFTSAPWAIEERLSVQRYPPGGGYVVWHTERTSATPQCVYRHLAFMTYLNDVDEGGETEFFHQELKVKPRKGLSLIWPVDWTHTHRGVAAPNEVKTITTGWIRFV
jgi:hypothetical protein